MRFEEYMILEEQSFGRLSKLVNNYIRLGWKPIGGASQWIGSTGKTGIHVGGIMQSMIRYPKSSSTKVAIVNQKEK